MLKLQLSTCMDISQSFYWTLFKYFLLFGTSFINGLSFILYYTFSHFKFNTRIPIFTIAKEEI